MSGGNTPNAATSGAFTAEWLLRSGWTREQAATILVRLADAMGQPLPEGTASFADNASIASWAVTAVDWARTCGFINGMSDGSFRPDGRATAPWPTQPWWPR